MPATDTNYDLRVRSIEILTMCASVSTTLSFSLSMSSRPPMQASTQSGIGIGRVLCVIIQFQCFVFSFDLNVLKSRLLVLFAETIHLLMLEIWNIVPSI